MRNVLVRQTEKAGSPKRKITEEQPLRPGPEVILEDAAACDEDKSDVDKLRKGAAIFAQVRAHGDAALCVCLQDIHGPWSSKAP